MKTVFALGVTFAVVGTVLVLAQDRPLRSTGYWSIAEQRKTQAELSPKARASNIAAKTLVTTPTHAIILATRSKGFAEAHEFDNDIFVVQDGEGTLQLGGELVDRKTAGPGQLSGSSIRGGDMIEASAGDVFYIPKNVPHMWHMREGQQVTYLAMKVTEK